MARLDRADARVVYLDVLAAAAEPSCP